MNEPRVAIGMPTYNRESYLKKAIDSLLGQTYRNIILLIADDGSTDGTQALCEAYAKQDPRLRYVRHKNKTGVWANTTYIIREIARLGDMCLITGDDDLWDPCFVEACVDVLIKNPDAAAAVPRWATLFESTGQTKDHDPKLFFADKRDLYGRLKQFMLLYCYDGRGMCMLGIFHNWVIKDESLRNEYKADVSFAFRCLSRGYLIFVDKGPLFYKQVRIGSESVEDQPLNTKRIRISFKNRIGQSKTEFGNISFVWGITALSFFEKCKLTLWECFVIGRLFVQRKT